MTVMINQVFPVKRQVLLEGLYLDQRLMERAAEIGRSLVLTDFLTDKNGVIAKATNDGHFEIPEKLIQSGRRIVIFTADSRAKSDKAQSLTNVNTIIMGSGEEWMVAG